MSAIVHYIFVENMGAHTCKVTWPKIEKQKTVFDLLSAVAQKKNVYYRKEEHSCVCKKSREKERGTLSFTHLYCHWDPFNI